ncbi:MAG: carbohydrate kinase family protein, partial [Candidatus Nomurabacteria bacterium]|nr:carbohydrate kinase family protein [Candidatus Nomurabacteria bacterium]
DVNSIDFTVGGGATNAATTFARGGHNAIFLGAIGHDPAGQAVLATLDDENIDASRISYSDKYHTGYSVLLLAPTGERTILTYRGASTHYQIEHFDLDKISEKIDWLYVSTMSGRFTILDKVFRQAAARGIKIAFNPGKRELAQPDKLKPLLDDVEILIANRQELGQIVEGASLEELVRHSQHFCPVVLGTDGAAGAICADRGKLVKAGLYDDVPAKDRTGAGDAFGSGFVLKYAESADLGAAITFASANSTAVIQKIGAKTGILRAGATLHAMPLEIKNL